jgi:hypothetical protein
LFEADIVGDIDVLANQGLAEYLEESDTVLFLLRLDQIEETLALLRNIIRSAHFFSEDLLDSRERNELLPTDFVLS